MTNTARLPRIVVHCAILGNHGTKTSLGLCFVVHPAARDVIARDYQTKDARTHPCPVVGAAHGPGRRQAGLDVAPGEVVLGLLEGRGGGQADGGRVGQLPQRAHQRGGSSASAVRAGGLVVRVEVQTRAAAELRPYGGQLRGRAGVSGYNELRYGSWETLAFWGTVWGPIGVIWGRTKLVAVPGCFVST